MAIRSPRELYVVLEKHLREASEPLTCVQLLDFPDVRESAIAEFGSEPRRYTDQVSNALGLMWRRNLLTRYPAPAENNSQARFAYEWIHSEPAPMKPTPPSLLSSRKTGALITESDGEVRIEFEKFVITVRQK